MTKSVFTDAYASLLRELVALRKRERVTQVELSSRLGKPQSFISTIERGVRRLDILEFYAIARALGVDPATTYADLIKALPDKVDV